MKIFRLQAIICALTLSVFSAAANATTFYFKNEPTTVTPNEIFTVDIFAILPDGLFAGGTDVFVDNALLTFAESPQNLKDISSAGLSCYGFGATEACPPLNTLPGFYTDPVGLPGSARFTYAAGLDPLLNPTVPEFDALWGTITVQAPASGMITLGGSLADTGEGLFDASFEEITDADFSDTVSIAVVPVPAAVWLFGSGLLGLVGVARRRKAA